MSILSLPGLRARQSDVITSELLPQVFSSFEADTCINILDVGVGRGDTVEFLKQYHHCKVYFLDLSGELADPSFDSFSTPFGQYTGTLFDLCLFWDLLYRLLPTQLEDLSRTLEGFIYSKTRVHSIANLSQTSERFRIHGDNQFKVVKGTQQSYPTRSITAIAQHFHCLSIEADLHRDDGRLELVLGTPV